MKKNQMVIGSWLIGMMLFSGIFSLCSAQADQPLVMAFNDTTSKPWKWEENGKYVGPFMDVMQEVADRSGVKVVLKAMPWARVLAEMKEGIIDGSFGGYKNAEREEVAMFLDVPMSWNTVSIFVRKGEEFPFDKIEDLYGKRIGIVRRYTTSKEFDQAMKEGKIPVEEVDDYRNLVRMLDAERIKGIAGATAAIQAHFTDMKMSDRCVALPHFVSAARPVYICISRTAKISNREAVVAKMSQVIRDMEKEKIFEKISQKYGYDKCTVFGCVSE